MTTTCPLAWTTMWFLCGHKYIFASPSVSIEKRFFLIKAIIFIYALFSYRFWVACFLFSNAALLTLLQGLISAITEAIPTIFPVMRCEIAFLWLNPCVICHKVYLNRPDLHLHCLNSHSNRPDSHLNYSDSHLNQSDSRLNQANVSMNQNNLSVNRADLSVNWGDASVNRADSNTLCDK